MAIRPLTLALIQQNVYTGKYRPSNLTQDLDKDFLNNLGLHTRTLIHVRKIATADLWSCPAIQLTRV